MTRNDFERICNKYNLEYHQEVFMDTGITNYFMLGNKVLFSYGINDFSYNDETSGKTVTYNFNDVDEHTFSILLKDYINNL